MHAEIKTWDRNGSVFSNRGYKRANEDQLDVDLGGVRILHKGVYTFKQLFRGAVNRGVYDMITGHYDASCGYPIVFGDMQFKVSKAGSKSGFQWVLRNYDLGMVVMLKSFYAELDDIGTHLKIEYSPHFIDRCDPIDIDKRSVEVASLFLDEYVFSDVAVHIAVDVKGWQPQSDLETKLRTRAKRNYTFAGVSEFDFDVNAVAVKYGQKESFTFGGAGSLQLCIYDKTKEMQQKDKAHLWGEIWSRTPGVEDPFTCEYVKGDEITRIEARFHHSVVRQFCKGTKGMEVVNFVELVRHLTGLYKYALDNFRLHHSKNYIDPFWQLLIEDVEVFGPHNALVYARSYKGESGSSRRNVAFWMGNAMRLFARQQFKVEYVVNYFMQSGLISDLKDYCKIPPNATESELSMVLHEFVRRRMEDHFLQGVHH